MTGPPAPGPAGRPPAPAPEPVTRLQRQDPATGAWEPAEPLPLYYGALARLLRRCTRGRWPR